MEHNAIYLKVTIHDNDFWSSQAHLGNLLQHIFKFQGYPTQKDLPYLQEIIRHLWYEISRIEHVLDGRGYNYLDVSYFDPDLEFVKFEDIYDWDNYETMYIPMFDGEIIVR